MKKQNYYSNTIILITLLITSSAIAEDFCVTTTTELNQALLSASVNNQDDSIKIEEGIYTVDSTGFFGNGFQYLGENENFDLEISGGWSEFMLNPCGQQFSNPFSTILNGDELRRVLLIQAGSGDITVTNLQISNGFLTGAASGGLNNGGGIRLELGGGLAKIERIHFINNNAFGAGALYVLGDGRVYLKNSLFLSNNTESGYSVVNIQAIENYTINNTIMFNSGGLYTHADLDDKSFIANNLLWENDNNDLNLTRGGNGEIYLYNNDIGIEVGHGSTIESGNISQLPEFEDGLLNFTPIWGSALINAGKITPAVVPIPTPFEFSWDYGLLDFKGADRAQNGRVDIGAFEAPTPPDLIFTDGFE